MKRLFLLIRKKKDQVKSNNVLHIYLWKASTSLCIYISHANQVQTLDIPMRSFSERLLNIAPSFCSFTAVLLYYQKFCIWSVKHEQKKNPAVLQYQLLNGKSIWKLQMRNVILSLFKLQTIFTVVNVLTLCRCKWYSELHGTVVCIISSKACSLDPYMDMHCEI